MSFTQPTKPAQPKPVTYSKEPGEAFWLRVRDVLTRYTNESGLPYELQSTLEKDSKGTRFTRLRYELELPPEHPGEPERYIIWGWSQNDVWFSARSRYKAAPDCEWFSARNIFDVGDSVLESMMLFCEWLGMSYYPPEEA